MSAIETLTDAFGRFVAERAGNEPEWLTARRRAAFDEFTTAGFPNRRDEEWKYVPTGRIAKTALTVGGSIDRAAVADAVEAARVGDEVATLVFVAGQYDAALSSIGELPDGVSVARLSASWDDACTKELLDATVPHRSAFDALRAAFLTDGAVVKFGPDAELAAPIHVIHVGAPGAMPWYAASANLIRVSGHARASVIESFVGVEGAVYLGSHRTAVRLGDGSALRHVRIQDDALTAFHVGTDDIVVSRDAAYHNFHFSLGGSVARDTTNVRVEGPGAHTELAALYAPNTGQTHDHHTLIDHRAPNCTADQLYKGILDGKGHGVFNGKIYVQQIAQQTAAEQLNQNLMISRDARIDTKPQLEIFADDVRCTHGATVGQIEPEELFYMMSRAIPEEAARRMLIRGFAEDTLERVAHEGAAARISELLDRRFGS